MALCLYQSAATTWKQSYVPAPPCTSDDPSQRVLVTQGEYTEYQQFKTGEIQKLNEPFDPVYAGGLFTFFFGLVVLSYFVSKNAGLILNAIRRW